MSYGGGSLRFAPAVSSSSSSSSSSQKVVLAMQATAVKNREPIFEPFDFLLQ